MESVRERAARADAASPAAAVSWWGPLAAAALLAVALGIATALGVDPRGDVHALALLAGGAGGELLRLPGAP